MLALLFDSNLDDAPIAFHPPPWVSIIAVVALSLTTLLAIFIYLGVWIVIWATLATAIAFGLWLRIGYAHPLSRRALPGHVLLIVVQLMQGAALLSGGYAEAVITALPGLIQPPNILTNASIALSLSLSASVIWLLGGAFAFYHIRVGGFVVLLLAVWSIVFPLSHIAMPLVSATAQGAGPGLATGLLLAALAIAFLRFISTLPRQRTLS